MATAIKFILFCVFVYAMILGFLRLYKLLNNKIIGSQTMTGVVGYALLLLAANVLLFFGGLALFYKLYVYLSV